MGQKVNPIGLRLGINRTWDSRWYADQGYAALLGPSKDQQVSYHQRGRLFYTNAKALMHATTHSNAERFFLSSCSLRPITRTMKLGSRLGWYAAEFR